MGQTRRDLLKFGGLGLGAVTLSGLGLPITALGQGAVLKAERPLDILILGGTGFTGPFQVRYALARGHRITLFNRGNRSLDWPAPVEELVGDRNEGNLEALKDRQWDVCIDNPTTLPFWIRDAGQVLQDNVGHYVFTSTLSVYASNAVPGADESAELLEYEGADAMTESMESLRADMGLYGPLKAESEREVARWFPERHTIIRPTLIVGPGDRTDRFTYWPLRMARGGQVLAPGDGSDPVQIIDARDVAEFTVRQAESRAGGAFNAAGPDYELTFEAMLHGIRAVTGVAAELNWAPAEFLVAQGINPWSDMPVWIPGEGEYAGFSRRSNAKAIAAGLTFRPVADTVRATLDWFHEQPEERQAEIRAGISAEREAEMLAALRAAA
ncbi:MAG: NAD-dependent epimerase/dehydratase family protein [Wenzhouxiangella sp.]|jgi:2'-hydroxyisoflavone reductase|nr:NAD-dependent epimerase/dehydratase family protein [Wenzhouxiangella sp.]